MKDFSSLLKKVSDLKAKVEQNSITPLYLGALLDDFISAIKSVDMTDMAADISAALSNAATALATAKQSLDAANTANTTADAAKSGAEAAVATANAAKAVAEAAKQATDSLAADVVSAQSDISAQGDAIVAMQGAVDVVKSNLTTLQGTLSTHIQSASAREAALHDSLSINAIVAFDGSVGDVSDDTTYSGAPIVRDPNQRVSQGANEVYFSTADQLFLIYAPDEKHYYSDWDNAYLWQDANGLPYADKAYYNVNNGRLYRFIDHQLQEIALTRLQNDIGIVPCIVRNASPAEIMTGYPVGRNYTIWWSQTDKQFYAAVEYDYDVNGVMIENCNCYKISGVNDEDRDMYQVYDKRHMSYVTRTDRIYRDRTQLYRYDAVNEQMVTLFDTSIINSESIVCSGTLDCNDFTAAAGEINGNLLVNSLEADGDISAANIKTDTVSAAKMQLGGVDANTLIVREFHGIRNSIPDGIIGVTDKVSVKPVEGASYDIIYIRTLKRFVALAEGSYSDRFIGEEYYNVITNNKPTKAREDRVWRCAGKLYGWDDEFTIINRDTPQAAYVGDLTCISDAAKEQFIKQWNEAFYKVGREYGKYNRETGYFEGNGLTDITYMQAQVIMKYVGVAQAPGSCQPKTVRANYFTDLANFQYDPSGTGCNSAAPRTFPPLIGQGAGGVYDNNYLFAGDLGLQAVGSAVSDFTGNEYVFYRCRNLRIVLGFSINDTSGTKNGMFNGCAKLEKLELKGLLQGTVDLSATKVLGVESVRYLIENRRTTVSDWQTNAKWNVTIKLSAEVFANLTDDIITLASEKNMTLVSA